MIVKLLDPDERYPCPRESLFGIGLKSKIEASLPRFARILSYVEEIDVLKLLY